MAHALASTNTPIVADNGADRLLLHLLLVVPAYWCVRSERRLQRLRAPRRGLLRDERFRFDTAYTPATPRRVAAITRRPIHPPRPRDRFGFRLAEVGQSVPILTTVQDVAFDERMMLAEHNRSKAAVAATRVHAVANSETARVTRRTTAGRLPRPATRRAHQPVCEPRERSWRPRPDHGVAIVCPRTPTVCLVDRFDDGLDGQRGPPPRLNRFSTTCSGLNTQSVQTSTTRPQGLASSRPRTDCPSRPREMTSREPAAVTVRR